jgi:tRNA A-37 threonylcarbamoyl transferase component Bud32
VSASDSRPWSLLQEGGAHGGGNQLRLYDAPDGRVLLKLYRRRGSRIGGWIKRLGAGPLEGRSGTTPRERCAHERESLRLWRAHGFDVPALPDRPLPPGLDPRTASWLEYCPGRRLSEVLQDERVPLDEKRGFVARLGRDDARRHALAIELDERRLLHENASVKHVIVFGERLVHFDLESGFHERVAAAEALAQELSTRLRSLARHRPQDFEALAGLYVASYAAPERLRWAADRGLHSPNPLQRIRRHFDRRRRQPGSSKAEMLEWLLAALGGAALAA